MFRSWLGSTPIFARIQPAVDVAPREQIVDQRRRPSAHVDVVTEFGELDDATCATDYGAEVIRYADAPSAGRRPTTRLAPRLQSQDAMISGFLCALLMTGPAASQGWDLRWMIGPPVADSKTPPPRLTERLRALGRSLYRSRCAGCHGESGDGEGTADGLAARSYLGTPVRIRDFTRGRFIRGAEMEDIYLTLRTGLEGTPMASYDALRDDEIWALAAHVRSLVRERPLYDLPPARCHARTP